MLFNMVLPGAVSEEPFAFEYSGNYTDNRVDGIGDVTLNTSGQLVTSGKTVTVSVYILAGGGGGADASSWGRRAGGGGGGYQTVEVTLEPGTYEIIIGSGGTPVSQSGTNTVTAGNGGDTIAFGFTSTGGKGATVSYGSQAAGNGGAPGGTSGTTIQNSPDGVASGGSPNGGGASRGAPQPGGDGYVELTFI